MVTTNTPRLGFHYYDDSLHYRAADLERWLPELQALGARWLTLLAPLNRAVPEPFISGLLAAGIQPVLHLRPVAPIHAVDLAELRPLLETYARWGVRYLCVFDRPNTRAAWTAADWSRPGLVDRFLELWLPLAGAQLAAGLEPVFPALEPGGDYWDTLFLEAALDGLLAREQGDLLPRLTFAFTAFTRGRPPAWGAGGPRRWPQTRPYLTPAGSQDQCGFRGFEWLSAVITDRLGAPRPLLCLAGGAAPEQRGDPAHTASEAGDHCQVNAALAALALGEVAGAGLALPDEVLNLNLWLLAAGPGSPVRDQAWFPPGEAVPLPVVAEVRRLAARLSSARAGTPVGEAAAGAAGAGVANGKPLFHYVLLPSFDWGASRWHLQAVQEYAGHFQPAVGFSSEEAARAEFVTIVGNEQGIPEQVAQNLQQQGCHVERINGPDGNAIVQLLAERVSSGIRFKNGVTIR